MNQPDSKHIHRSVSRFRKLALLSALSVMVLNVWMVSRTISVLDHGSGTKINLSGGQRALSQRIRSDAFEIETAVRYGSWDRLGPLLADLEGTTRRFDRAHRQLFAERGHAELFREATTRQLDTIASIETPQRRIVAGSEELQKLTRSVIRRAPYIDDLTHRRILAVKDEITDAQNDFMPRMETIVSLFEEASRDEIETSIGHARIGMLVLLGVVTASVLFIIEPTILIIRRQLQDLDRATRSVRRADAVRWRLLTNMGHEFRTPMNAIMGFAELITDESLSAAERSRLGESIHESSAHLARLIETMLDLSAVESGQLGVVLAPCDLPELLRDIGSRALEQAETKGLELRIELDRQLPPTIITDARRLEQIVVKLLDNAIKFTESGRIELRARPARDAEPGRLEFMISDTGVGVAPEHIDAIFDPFRQAQDDLTRRFGGAGLGLTVARDMARALGGDIGVVSAPGHGSTFTLTIDAQVPAQAGEPEPPATQPDADANVLAGVRVLIVDDAQDNRVLLKHIFKRLDADTEFALDGQQAIQSVARATQQARPFELILMDMQMPVLDGYSATAQLRQQGVTTPVIALTAHALAGDRQRCLEAGCDEYISKPVNRAKLLNACAALLADRTPPAAAA